MQAVTSGTMSPSMRREWIEIFRGKKTDNGEWVSLHDESGFIALIADFNVVRSAVAAEGKQLITLRKRKEKSARNTAVAGVNGGGAVPVRVGAEDGNLTVCVALKIVDLTSFHISFGVHINAGGLVENLDISGWLHHTVESVAAFFQLHTTHFKADDEVSLFDESVVEVAAVHAGIAGSADRAGRRVQTGDFGGHVLIGSRGHVDTVAGLVFED